jgi:hypothetical protein
LPLLSAITAPPSVRTEDRTVPSTSRFACGLFVPMPTLYPLFDVNVALEFARIILELLEGSLTLKDKLSVVRIRFEDLFWLKSCLEKLVWSAVIFNPEFLLGEFKETKKVEPIVYVECVLLILSLILN